MDKTMIQSESAPILETLAGALILAVGMGFGRFSFTGMYPLMVKEAVISVAGGSFSASANYAGYLVGALLASRVDRRHSALLCQLSMLGTLTCLLLLSLHLGTGFVVADRFVAGAMSAVSMVAASIWLFHVVGYHHGAPVLYSGVGLGIVVSAELIALGGTTGLSSAGLWILLAAAAAILCLVAWSKVTSKPRIHTEEHYASAGSTSTSRSNIGPWILIVIYGLAGFGYIVTATYLPLLVRTALPHTDPVHVWAVFGLGAAPSCFLWHWLHRRLGTRVAMSINLIVQAVGVVLPVVDPTALAFLGSAVLVGGTFMGTVTILMSAAKRVAHHVRFNLMGTLTAAFGIGQILGPLVANQLFAHTQSFNRPLMAAGAALVIAALACFVQSTQNVNRDRRRA